MTQGVILAPGPHFSSGHDLREPRACTTDLSASRAGAEAQMAREKEIYLGFCERWRNIPKPTIAVEGKIAGGLMLIWPCDIIIASEEFRPVSCTRVRRQHCGSDGVPTVRPGRPG